MNYKKIITELVKKAGKDEYVLNTEVIKYAKTDSAEFFQIEKLLLDNNIIIMIDEDAEEEIIEIVDEDEKEDIEALDEEPDDLSLSSLEDDADDIDDLFSEEALREEIKVDDPVRMYLKEIGKINLLTFAEEQKYARFFEEGKMAQDQLNLHKNEELDLNADEIGELEGMVFKGEHAKEKLVEGNYRLVVSIAKRYTGRGMQFLDLIQEGNMGLMRAVDKFDYEKGFKFSTYATWWIRQAITRAVADQARTIRIPVHMVETINKMVRIQRQLVQELNREPTVDEIAKSMELTPEKVQNIQRISREPISLEAPVGEEEDSMLGDFISDPNALSPHDHMIHEMIESTLDDVLATLSDREEKVLRLRYGLYGGKTHTLEEVGKIFGVTRERIRQIEAKALRRLRHPSKQNKLKEFYNKK